METPARASHPGRLDSLDVFRGIAIAAMLIVNNPGSWQHAYPCLRHAGWTGCGLPDLVFPFFLFIVGASLAFSLFEHTRGSKAIAARSLGRLLRRALLLFLTGVFLNAFPEIFLWLVYGITPDFSTLRIMGILQRISLIYLATSLAVLYFSLTELMVLTVVILLGYWGVLMLVPVPGGSAGNLSPDGNVAFYIDRIFFSARHMFGGKHIDPEGLFSTIPAITTSLTGYVTGRFMHSRPKNSLTALGMLFAGIGLLAAGYTWSRIFPLCKDLWTSSYV
ncbi:MAG: heparan-alpha-glucosaminide N-acetyltransferase domain-containing protein, partial [Pseudomonadota bacterium]